MTHLPSPPEAAIHSSAALVPPLYHRLHQSLADRLVRRCRGVEHGVSFLPSHRFRCATDGRSPTASVENKKAVKSDPGGNAILFWRTGYPIRGRSQA
jgi:hypothetical protein